MFKTINENSHTNSQFCTNCRLYINLLSDLAGNEFLWESLECQLVVNRVDTKLEARHRYFFNDFIHKAPFLRVDEFVQHINRK